LNARPAINRAATGIRSSRILTRLCFHKFAMSAAFLTVDIRTDNPSRLFFANIEHLR
jgi:hypothetical protein